MRFLSSILHVGVHCTLPTVSWAVQCVLTLDHLPVSPMSNANHTGRQCSDNPAISKLLSHSFTSPHRLYCGRKHRATKNSTRMCFNCNCNSNVSHQRCQDSALHNSEQSLYEHKHEAAIMNWSPRLHRRFIEQPSHWKIYQIWAPLDSDWALWISPWQLFKVYCDTPV